MTDITQIMYETSCLRRVIIESPCAALPNSTWEDHQDYLADALRDSISRGEAPIASHGLFAFSNIFNDADAKQRRACMLAGHAWLNQAEAVIVYADLGISAGMQQGIDLAKRLSIPVEIRRIR